jgi:uncharacterized OB-fold protein
MIVTKALWELGGRKYIELDGKKVKVPFRYNRVMCKVEGLMTVQEMEMGQKVKVTIEEKTWQGQTFLVLKEIEALYSHVES